MSFPVQDSDRDYGSAPVSVAELRSHDPMEMARDLAAALTREQNLKSRVHELVSTLEKITQNSEVRHKQSAEFVNDLKRANRWGTTWWLFLFSLPTT